MGGWAFYMKDTSGLFTDKIGKWMIFFDDIDFAKDICSRAVLADVVVEAKHSDRLNDKGTGVACFYLNIDDTAGHKKVIQFFLDNDLIRVTKAGKLYNISFKLDNETRSGLYGSDFKSQLK